MRRETKGRGRSGGGGKKREKGGRKEGRVKEIEDEE